jgi:hypothetical protein
MKIKYEFYLKLAVIILLISSCEGESSNDENGNPPDNSVSQNAEVTTEEIAGNPDLAKFIAGISATGGGNVLNEGSSAVSERGICWNTAGNPTTNDPYSSDGSGSGIFLNAEMTGLTVNTVYHLRAYAVNGSGTFYGNEVTFNSGYAFDGTIASGGMVFYNDGNGSGLIAGPVIHTPLKWIEGGATQTTINNNTSYHIGTGLANSNAIVAQAGHSKSAAKTCFDYTGYSYDDWYLPSKFELDLVYQRLNIYIDTPNFVWSSTEYNTMWGCRIDFSNGTDANTWKYTPSVAIPVRNFKRTIVLIFKI